LENEGKAEEGKEPVTPDTSNGTETQSDWFYTDGVKGNGDKPEWLADKYKSVADKANGYSEIQKKFSNFTGAPEKYDLVIDGNEDVRFADEDH